MTKLHSISLFALAVASLYATPALAREDPAAPVATAPADPVAPGDAVVQAEPQDRDIIVTGTRRTGTTAAESLTPIKVLGSEALSHVGQPNLNQVLTQLVPSFTAQAFGGDTANLTLSARPARCSAPTTRLCCSTASAATAPPIWPCWAGRTRARRPPIST